MLSGPQKERLALIEKAKFEELHTVLLQDNGFANLMEQMQMINNDLKEIEEVEEE